MVKYYYIIAEMRLYMKKIIYYLCLNLVCCFIWIILNEKLSIQNLLIGSVLGVISIYLSENFLLDGDYRDFSKISPKLLVKYLLYLFYQIFYSGFMTIGKIITGKINPGIVEISTRLDNDAFICLLANSITLTPGTVTLNKSGCKLKVLWLDCITMDSDKAGEIIKGKFEKILMGG